MPRAKHVMALEVRFVDRETAATPAERQYVRAASALHLCVLCGRACFAVANVAGHVKRCLGKAQRLDVLLADEERLALEAVGLW